MADDIKFDHAKAQNLLDTFDECNRYLDELTNILKSEVNGAGEWWKGESYEAFKGKFEGAGRAKSVLEGLSKKNSDTSNYLSKVAESKRTWEKSASKYF